MSPKDVGCVVLFVALAFLTLHFSTGALAAQDSATVHEIELPDSLPLRVTVRPIPAASRPGGYGFVQFIVANPGPQARRVLFTVGDAGMNVESYRNEVEVDVEPSASRTVRMLLPFVNGYMEARIAVDRGASRHLLHFSGANDPNGLSVLVVAGAEQPVSSWQAMFDRQLARFAPSSIAGSLDPRSVGQAIALAPHELPDDWRMISGFDLVVVDARTRGADDFAQAALADYVLAGGALLLVNADQLPTGRLVDLAASGRWGFGSLLALDSDASAGLPSGSPTQRASDGIFELFGRDEQSPVHRAARGLSGPIAPDVAADLEIPGIGRPPLRAFFFVVLAFAFLVGPVNYFWCRRRKQLPLLLVTVTAGGIATTVLLLGWGVLAEGFGVKQTERWITVLDQPARHAVSWGTRTMFAGSAPSRLTPRAGTWTWNPSSNDGGQRTRPIFAPRADGTLEGGLVPSRTITTLAHVTIGPERARLRFRRDGGLREPLADGSFVPRPGSIVLREFDGAYFIGRSDGRLEPAGADDAARVLLAIGRASWLSPLPDGMRGNVNWYEPRQLDIPSQLARLVADDPGDVLRPGSYVALVERSPGADDLGVAATTLASAHLVVGRIGQEDIVD